MPPRASRVCNSRRCTRWSHSLRCCGARDRGGYTYEDAHQCVWGQLPSPRAHAARGGLRHPRWRRIGESRWSPRRLRRDSAVRVIDNLLLLPRRQPPRRPRRRRWRRARLGEAGPADGVRCTVRREMAIHRSYAPRGCAAPWDKPHSVVLILQQVARRLRCHHLRVGCVVGVGGWNPRCTTLVATMLPRIAWRTGSRVARSRRAAGIPWSRRRQRYALIARQQKARAPRPTNGACCCRPRIGSASPPMALRARARQGHTCHEHASPAVPRGRGRGRTLPCPRRQVRRRLHASAQRSV